MKMDTIGPSGPPAREWHVSLITCVPRVQVEMNGVDQKVVGHAKFDTIVIRVVSANSAKFVQKKKNGQPTFTCTETVSHDGRTMTEEFSKRPLLRGHRIRDVHAGDERTGRCPPALGIMANANHPKRLEKKPTVTYQWIGNGLRIAEGGTTTEAKFDGKDYPVEGEPYCTVSLRMVDRRTVEEDRRVVRTVRMTVSEDGKSMKVHSHDDVRGGEMSYTAEKRPQSSRPLGFAHREGHKLTLEPN